MNGSNEVIANEPLYLVCERRYIFALLMCAGGYMGAFTYVLRGGVFCNAQTANFVPLSIALGQGLWKQAAYYFVPMTAYFAGAVVSELLPDRLKRYGLIRWDTLLVGLEMLVLLWLGFLPESAPFQITQVAINFIASMQYNTFRQAKGIPMATTFCTNHLRHHAGRTGSKLCTGDRKFRREEPSFAGSMPRKAEKNVRRLPISSEWKASLQSVQFAQRVFRRRMQIVLVQHGNADDADPFAGKKSFRPQGIRRRGARGQCAANQRLPRGWQRSRSAFLSERVFDNQRL